MSNPYFQDRIDIQYIFTMRTDSLQDNYIPNGKISRNQEEPKWEPKGTHHEPKRRLKHNRTEANKKPYEEKRTRQVVKSTTKEHRLVIKTTAQENHKEIARTPPRYKAFPGLVGRVWH